MKRFPKILAATCAVLALTSSLALAADAPKRSAKSAPAEQAMPAGQMDQMGPMGMAGQPMGPMGAMGLAGLTPEKQELAKALMAEHRKALFPLHQSLYAKTAELEALNAADEGESGKAKAVIREIADLGAKMLIENGKFRTRLVKETGLRTAPMGHGMMGGGMSCPMMEGMKGGMMGGMMSGMKGDMQHGAAPAPAADPAKTETHDAHAM